MTNKVNKVVYYWHGVCFIFFRFLRGGEDRGTWRITSWGKEENQRQLNHIWRPRPNLNPVRVF